MRNSKKHQGKSHVFFLSFGILLFANRKLAHVGIVCHFEFASQPKYSWAKNQFVEGTERRRTELHLAVGIFRLRAQTEWKFEYFSCAHKLT